MKTSINKHALVETVQGAIKLSSSQKNQTEGKGVFFVFKDNDLTIYGVGDVSFYSKTLKMTKPLFDNEVCVGFDHKKLCDFVQGFPIEAVDVESVSGGIVVSLGNTSARFQASPPLPKPQVGGGVEDVVYIDPKIISENLRNLLFCTSSDSSRPTLSSIKLIPQDDKRVLMVATDGFRLSVVQTSFSDSLSKPLQIPATFLRDVFGGILNSQEKVRLSSLEGGGVLLGQEGGVSVGTRLVAGDFPPYERVLLKTFQYNFIFSKEDVLRATKSMSVFAREFSNIIVFDITPTLCTIRPKKESGQENKSDVPFEGSGLSSSTSLSIAFNFHYILDYLSSVEDEHFTVRVGRADAPVLFLPGRVDQDETHEGALYQHIIMPVRIQE